MEKNMNSTEALNKMKEMAEDIRICMLTNRQDGKLYGRPMTTIQVDNDGTIWFFTSEHTSSAQQSADGEEVCLNYSHPAKNEYLTIQGHSQLSHDKAKMDEMWSPMLEAWFPQGLKTSDIALLKVTPDAAHYWDSDASRMKILWGVVKAAVTGERIKEEGQHGELNIK